MKSLSIIILLSIKLLNAQNEEYFKISRENIFNKDFPREEKIYKPDLNLENEKSASKYIFQIMDDSQSKLKEQKIKIWNGYKWINFQLAQYEYEQCGKRTIIKNWINDSWVNFKQIYTTFNNDNLTVEELYQDWIENKWKDYWKSNFNYENGKLIEETYMCGDGKLKNYLKYSYKYNDKGILKEELYQNWRSSCWFDVHKIEFVYDNEGNLTSQTCRVINNMRWENKSRKLFKYEKRDLIEAVIQYFDENELVNSRIYKYLYDRNRDLIERSVMNWKNGMWDYYWQCLYEYQNGNSERTAQIWNGHTWENYWFCSKAYNSDNLLVEEVNKKWSQNEWENVEVFAFNYDDKNNIKCTEYKVWNGSNWIPQKMSIYNYCLISNSTKELTVKEVFKLENNYPNPFNPSTKIQYSIPEKSSVTLKVFDALGSEVATLVDKDQPKGNYEVVFEPSSFGISADRRISSGVYFYRLQARPSGCGTDNPGLVSGQVFVETKKMLLVK